MCAHIFFWFDKKVFDGLSRHAMSEVASERAGCGLHNYTTAADLKMLTVKSRPVNEELIDPLREKLLLLQGEEGYDGDEITSFCQDEHNLRRFLVARDNNPDKSYEMAAAAIKWRSEIKPTTLTVADFDTANSQGVWRFAGYAKNGWPIMLVRTSLFDPCYTTEEYVRYIAYMMEKNIERMDPSNANGQRHFIIFDMHDMNYNTDYAKLRELIRIANDYHPERLGIALTVNASTLFWGLWKIMSPWMDTYTSEKVKVFTSDYKDFLDEHVGLENVYTDLGGKKEEDWPTPE